MRRGQVLFHESNRMAGSGISGRVSRPFSGELVSLDGVATDCGNDVNKHTGPAGSGVPRRPVATHEGDALSLKATPSGAKHAGDVSMASRNHHRPRRPSYCSRRKRGARKFSLPCLYCDKPVSMNAGRFIELFDADKRPVCRRCLPYSFYLEAFHDSNSSKSGEVERPGW